MFSHVLQQGDWSNHIYTKGCIAALEDWLPGNLYTVAIVFIVISLLQVTLITVAIQSLSHLAPVVHLLTCLTCVSLWTDGGDLPGQDSDLRHREGEIQLLNPHLLGGAAHACSTRAFFFSLLNCHCDASSFFFCGYWKWWCPVWMFTLTEMFNQNQYFNFILFVVTQTFIMSLHKTAFTFPAFYWVHCHFFCCSVPLSSPSSSCDFNNNNNVINSGQLIWVWLEQGGWWLIWHQFGALCSPACGGAELCPRSQEFYFILYFHICSLIKYILGSHSRWNTQITFHFVVYACEMLPVQLQICLQTLYLETAKKLVDAN